MSQFLDNFSVTTTLRMQRSTPARDGARFTARFVIEAGPLRLVKEFDLSEDPEAFRALRRLANTAFTAWLQALAADLAAGTAISAAQIEVDDKGWAKVVLRADHDRLDDVTLEIPDAEDLWATERAAIGKLEAIVNRTLRRQAEINGALSSPARSPVMAHNLL